MNSSGNFSFNSSDYDVNKTDYYNTNKFVRSDFEYSIEVAFSAFNEYVEGVFYPVTMVTGIVGNALVIIVIVKVKGMLNSTNIFLVNLAIADIIVLLVWGFRHIYSIYNLDFLPYSSTFWQFWFFTENTLINASVLTVLAIGYERYYAICQPLKTGYICTKKRAVRISILTWIFAALSCSPAFLNGFWDFYWQRLLNFIDPMVFFILPPIVLSVLFSLMVRHLRIAAAHSVNSAAIRHRQQVVRMLAIVFICFFLLQMPYRVYNFCFDLWRMTHDSYKTLYLAYWNVYITFEMLLCLHSAVNPILYNLMSTRFREGFKSMLCQCAPRCFKSQI